MKITRSLSHAATFDITDLTTEEFEKIYAAYTNAVYRFPNKAFPDSPDIDTVYDKLNTMRRLNNAQDVTV